MRQSTAQPRWDELDEATRRELDRQYMADLPRWHEGGVTDVGIAAYLAYRRERPGAQITTYEEGQIRRILHESSVPVEQPDPVGQEEHIGRVEQFGARVLHLTNDGTYLAVMVTLTLLFFATLVALVMLF